mgnify:CR=1 FL=1
MREVAEVVHVACMVAFLGVCVIATVAGVIALLLGGLSGPEDIRYVVWVGIALFVLAAGALCSLVIMQSRGEE